MPTPSPFALSEPPLSASELARAEADTLPPPPTSGAHAMRRLPKAAPLPPDFVLQEEVCADLSRDWRAEPAEPADSADASFVRRRK